MPRKRAKTDQGKPHGFSPERHAVYRLQAEMCRALGHPERLAIIDLLKTGERRSAELLRFLDIGKVNLSRHLTVLKHAGLVESRTEGREALYRLAFCEIGSACSGIRQILALRLRRNAKLAKTIGFPQNEAG